jgi:hypothetical protein
VVLPGVGVPERGVDSALCGARVRPHRVEFRHNRHVGSRFLCRYRRAESGPTRADDDDVVFVHGVYEISFVLESLDTISDCHQNFRLFLTASRFSS